MHLANVKISGFKSIPPCATYNDDTREPNIQWNNHCFQFTLPTACNNDNLSLMLAFIGANSAGKSNILLSLDAFFSNKSKLPLDCFNGKQDTFPVIIEIKFVGKHAEINGLLQDAGIGEFANDYCEMDGDFCYLRVGILWPAPDRSGRFYYIRKLNGSCSKVTSTKEKEFLTEKIFPKFITIRASARLSDEATLSKSSLLQELINDIIQTADPPNGNRRNVIVSIRRKLDELKALVERSPRSRAWRLIEELESHLSTSLENITPEKVRVTIDISSTIPELRSLFYGGTIKIADGVDLDFDKHGLGLQRSFALALLKTWCDRIGDRSTDQDYLFAVEEPEIYLHPHATRVMLNTLQGISKRHQVVFTTHSNEFVNHVPLENIRLVRRKGNKSTVTVPDFSTLPSSDLYKVRRHLQEAKSDALFARAVLLVEGQSEWYAMPHFAEKLSLDLDGRGISVVYTQGKGNFRIYHLILEQFGIPHVLLGDGDGNKQARVQEYTTPPFQLPPDRVFVLEHDFERELVSCLSNRRICKIVNDAREEIGKPQMRCRDILRVPAGRNRNEYLAKQLQNLGKPLIGRIVGQILSKNEIKKLHPIKDALERVVEIART